MLGNDVVDLRCPDLSFHPRFPSRVLSKSEYDRFLQHAEPHLYLWKAWAAREASYKAMKRRDPSFTFHPSEYFFEEDENFIFFEKKRLPLQFEVTSDFIHCVVVDSSKKAVVGVEENRKAKVLLTNCQSIAVRDLAKRLFSFTTGVDENDIEVKSNRHGIPYIEIKSTGQSFPVSLSHHGRYVAAALKLTEITGQFLFG